MNYYDARQRNDAKWDYTCQNDGAIWPIGYCAGWREVKDTDPSLLAKSLKRVNEEFEPFRHKFHDEGHATKEEACACYREYLLDTRLRFYPSNVPPKEMDPAHPPSQRECLVCKKWTNCFADIDQRQIPLCAEHLNRKAVEAHFSVGECWSSY